MQDTDTPERALDLLDQAARIRLNTDPNVGVFDAETDEPLNIGVLGLNIEVYVELLCSLERTDSMLGLLGWEGPCPSKGAHCEVPHRAFASYRAALRSAADSSRDWRYSDVATALDNLLDGDDFGEIHRQLADQIRRGSDAACAPIEALRY